jgi:hypothetical protein
MAYEWELITSFYRQDLKESEYIPLHAVHLQYNPVLKYFIYVHATPVYMKNNMV